MLQTYLMNKYNSLDVYIYWIYLLRALVSSLLKVKI